LGWAEISIVVFLIKSSLVLFVAFSFLEFMIGFKDSKTPFLFVVMC